MLLYLGPLPAPGIATYLLPTTPYTL